MTAEAANGDQADPIWVGEVELSEPLRRLHATPARGRSYREARILVRLHRRPIGCISLPVRDDAIDAAIVREAIWRELATPLRAHLEAAGVPLPNCIPPGGLAMAGGAGGAVSPLRSRFVSVVVCSRDRAEILRTCLQALKALQYSSFEVVVVDNAPSTSETSEMFARHFAADSRFRYVEEPAPGLSRARNRGLRTARGEIIAYTDDDVRVDPWWLNGIVEGFARHDGTGCVTGLVLAAELESDAQRYFDSRVSWNSSCEGRIYDQGENRPASPLYPYAAGLFGTGANFAFDRQFLMSLGGFDEALGAGAPTRGGEDLDIFVRAVLSGRPLVYEPAAVVWHTHRSEHGELIEQMYSYGLGLTAYITKFLTDPRTAAKLLFHLPQALIHAKKMLGKGDTGATGRVAALAEKSLLRAELRGMLNGPRAYYRGRRIAGGGWAVRSTASGEAASRPAA